MADIRVSSLGGVSLEVRGSKGLGMGWEGRERVRVTYTSSEGEVAAETHARAPDAAIAVGVGEEVVNRLGDILIVRVEGLKARRSVLSSRLTWAARNWQ